MEPTNTDATDGIGDSDAEGTSDQLAEDAADLILEANESLEQRRAEQEAFLETVEEETDAPVVETTCNILADYTVDVTARLDGELTDRLGEMEARLERVDAGEGHAYDISEVADETSQMLADLIDDETWDKPTFYEAYERTGVEPLLEMFEEVFDSIKTERERMEGVAEGFRPQR